MEITDVRIVLHTGGKLRAFASVTFDDAIVVRGIKIIETQRRTFVAMPSRESRGKQADICHPTNQATRSWLEGAILAAYEDAVRKTDGRPARPAASEHPNELNVQ